MSVNRVFIGLMLWLVIAAPLHAEEKERDGEGVIFTLWPLLDYRESPKERFSNLSILGPLFKLQNLGEDKDVAIRPLFYRTTNSRNETTKTNYIYPIASSDISTDVSRVQVLQLFQRNIYRKGEGEEQEKSTMLFPFYISGNSKKYGPYTSVFPIYGDIYERFWKDEYHFVMFPLYGRTVKKGTTSRNYLYPFFSTIEGTQESGFQFWPLYGEAAKDGVYSRQFVLWPFFLREKSGLDTENPTTKCYFLPFYAATDSPQATSRYYFWPFFGHSVDTAKQEEEWNYFWPFLRKVRGKQLNADTYLPLYSNVQMKERSKTWYMWPLYRHEEMKSDIFLQERDRILFFLYSRSRENWPKDGKERQRTTLWPLFLYDRDVQGVNSLAVPALVEPVFDNEGIEKNWAPLWRLYQQKWKDNGDSAASLLWNLYWHEVRGDELAYEFFPLVSYRSEKQGLDLKLLKGLIRYRNNGGEKGVSLLWLPFGAKWGKADAEQTGLRSKP